MVEWVKVDTYGRKLGKVLLDGLDCNLVQIKRGLAWHYKQYQREQSPADQQSYAAAEIEARAAKLDMSMEEAQTAMDAMLEDYAALGLPAALVDPATVHRKH